MSQFQQYVDFKCSNKIAISLEAYEAALTERLKNVVWREDYIESSEAEKVAIEQCLLNQHYPQTNPFMVALSSMNPRKIQAAYSAYQEWNQGPMPEALFQFKAYCLYGAKPQLNEQETLRLLMHKTSKNMHKLGKLLETASLFLPGFKSLIGIVPKEPQGREWVYPVEKAVVEVSRPPASGKFGCGLAPGGLEVWTLDENSEAFYVDDGLQRDFFGLIKEIQQPRSVSARKVMTLYFNATCEERDVYADARRQLSVLGNAEIYPRLMTERAPLPSIHDTWKVRVDTRHLVQVQPGEYEPAGNNEIPIKYIELIGEGAG
jgi:hypothetical protein